MASEALKSGITAVGTLWPYRILLVRLVARSFSQSYRGSVFGFAWAILQPLLVLLAYWFLFGLVLKSRWPDGGGVPLYAIIFSGLIVAGFFAECLNGGVGSIIANANYVKKVVFPLEIQAIVICISAYVHLVINVVILALFLALGGGDFSWWILAAPLTLAPLLLIAVGAVWLLSALAVYLRDLIHIVPIATSLLLFFSPIFYPMMRVPAGYRQALWINPLTAPVELMHVSIGMPSDSPLIVVVTVYILFAIVMLILGRWVFGKLRRGFADVL